MFQKILAEVLAVGWQLMMHEIGEELLQLEEETFARLVAVGVHVEGNWSFGGLVVWSFGDIR